MVEETVWNPADHEEGFVPTESLMEEDSIYKIIDAVEADNQWGSKELQMTLEAPNGEELILRLRISNRKGSKFNAFLESLAKHNVALGAASDLVGLRFVAHKETELGTFPERDAQGNETGKRVEKEVTTVTVKSLDGASPAAEAAAADDDTVLELLADIADNQAFPAILTATADIDELKDARKQIQNKKLLNQLIENGVLKLEGRIYHKV